MDVWNDSDAGKVKGKVIPQTDFITCNNCVTKENFPFKIFIEMDNNKNKVKR